MLSYTDQLFAFSFPRCNSDPSPRVRTHLLNLIMTEVKKGRENKAKYSSCRDSGTWVKNTRTRDDHPE